MDIKTYTVEEAEQFLHVQSKTIRNYIKQGKLKATKAAGGKRWIINESDLLDFINANTNAE